MTDIVSEVSSHQILIVDDSSDDTLVLQRVLQTTPYDIRTTQAGAIALDTARSLLPDLIVLDITQYDLCRQLRADERTREISVIITHRPGDLTDLVPGVDMDTVEYLAKPLQALEVLTRIKTQLTLRTLQQQSQGQHLGLSREYHHPPHLETPEVICLLPKATLADLPPVHTLPITATTLGCEVMEVFQRQPTLPGVVIVEGTTLLGIITRGQFFEYFSRPYGVDLFGIRPIHKLLTEINRGKQVSTGARDTISPCLILPIATTIPEATALALARPDPYTYDPVVLNDAHQSWQLLSMNTLLRAHTQLFTQANQILQERDDQLQLVVQLTQAINAAPDVNAALAAILQSLCETTGWGYGEAWIESPDRTVLECSPSWYGDRLSITGDAADGLDNFRYYSEALTFLPGEGLPGRVWQQCQPEWITDLSVSLDEVFSRHEQGLACQFRAGFGVPIIATPDPYETDGQQRVLAVLVFLTPTVTTQDDRWQRLVTTIASQLGSILAKKQAQVELRTLFNVMNDLVLVYDASGRCLRIAPTHQCELYRPMRGMVGKLLSDIVPKPQATQVLSCIQESLRTRKTVRTRYSLWLDDRQVFLSSAISPLTDHLVVIVGRDITDQQRAEQALRQSEAQNRAIIVAIPDLLVRLHRDGTYLDYIPAKISAAFSARPDQRIGRNIYDVLPYENAAYEMELVQRTLETGECVTFEQQLTLDDGNSYSEEVRITACSEDEVLLIIRDITESKRLEQDLSNSQQLLDSIVETMPMALFVKDAHNDFRYVLWNRAAEEIYGIPREQILGQRIEALVAPDLADRITAEYQHLVENKQLVIEDELFTSKFRGDIWQRIRKLPLVNDRGQVTHLLYMAEDVTVQRRMEQEIQAANAELQALFAAMNELVIVRDRQGYCLKIPMTKAKGNYKPVEEQLGKSLDQVFSPDIAEMMLRSIHQALDTRKTLTIEYSLPIDNNQVIWSEASISSIDDQSVVWVVRDITARKQAEEILRLEKERSEKLLLNILPEAIATRLKQDNRAIADSFTHATILFADIVNFTQLSGDIIAEELVDFLNQIFSLFDDLCDHHGLEKIKTIGDAYMAVGGLPAPRPDHTEAIANLALDMQTAIHGFKTPNSHAISLRIGINTGTVVAGIIGKKKFIYDLWGDAVNVASRMESQGESGKIQVTEAVYERLKHQYQLQQRGTVSIKGKGDMVTYWLTGK